MHQARRAASASFHYALTARFKRQRAAAELRRYAANEPMPMSLAIDCSHSQIETKLTRRVAILVLALSLCALAFGGATAHAARLELSPDAPGLAHAGAALLLYFHIGGGIIGLLAGALAIASRKGGTTHRSVGNVFFVSMLVTYLIGAGVAPFLTEGQRTNFVAGILALYLLISGWRTATRQGNKAGPAEMFGFVIALAVTALGLLFMHMAANSPNGTVDGSPPQAFLVFVVAGSVAAVGELNVLLRRGISGAARVARHLWRMCFSLFIASGSLFLGQPQVFPDWFKATPLPFAFALAPLVAMAIWLTLVRCRRLELGRAHARRGG
jgi:uncharacterized membrane protein